MLSCGQSLIDAAASGSWPAAVAILGISAAVAFVAWCFLR